jgi:hypothetical protein
MTPEQLEEDARAAHAVFDLCGIRKTNRGTTPLTLRMRALILAGAAGKELTQEQVTEHLKKNSN